MGRSERERKKKDVKNPLKKHVSGDANAFDYNFVQFNNDFFFPVFVVCTRWNDVTGQLKCVHSLLLTAFADTLPSNDDTKFNIYIYIYNMFVIALA